MVQTEVSQGNYMVQTEVSQRNYMVQTEVSQQSQYQCQGHVLYLFCSDIVQKLHSTCVRHMIVGAVLVHSTCVRTCL